jgi:hypothetical protein
VGHITRERKFTDGETGEDGEDEGVHDWGMVYGLSHERVREREDKKADGSRGSSEMNAI